MARVINVGVTGEFIDKDSKFGGVQGEGNTTTLHLTFDASWDGYGKRVVWRNAKGEDPVAVVLTQSAASMAEPDYNQRVYDTPIPTEPMKLPGWCTFTIEGYKADTPGAIALTVCDALEVQANDSFYAPAEPTPSQAQQLLGSIEQIKPDMEAFAKESKSWAVGGTGSRDGEDTDNSKYYSQQSKESSEESARQAVLAENSKEEATRQAGLAAASAVAADSSAQESKNHADEAAEEVSKASDQAKLSRSWAVGGTGSREGEDSNNAKYWASVAEGIAGGGVSTFNGRSGAVLPMKGDYTPEMVGAASLGPDGKVPTDQLPEMDYDPAGTADSAVTAHNTSGTAHSDIRNALSGHTGNKSNPHGVTAAQVGAYTREQVMASTIPTLFGLGAGAVPSDVLKLLSRFQSGLGNEYLWEKTKVTTTFEYENSTNTLVSVGTSLWISNSVELVDGVVTMVSPQKLTVEASGDFVEKLTNVYLTTSGVFQDPWFCTSAGYSAFSVTLYYYSKVKAVTTTESFGYVNSSSPDAYPPAVPDGYTYNALGQVGNKVQIETGRYIGTGKYGRSSPNSLALSIEPEILIVCDVSSSYFSIAFLNQWSVLVQQPSGHNLITYSWSNSKEPTWYSTQSAMEQLNMSGYTYKYIAVG